MAALLIGWLIVGGLFGSLIQMMLAYTEIDELDYDMAFWFAITFYENNCEQLNRAGLIIGVTFISIIVLPGSILIIVLSAIQKLVNKLWSLYKHVFRKNDNDRRNTND